MTDTGAGQGARPGTTGAEPGTTGAEPGTRTATEAMRELDFGGLRATFVNCTLKRSPERSHTQGLIDVSAGIMRDHGVDVREFRAVDHDIATGV